MRAMVCVALIGIIVTCLGCNREANWLAFSTYEGGFMIEAPGQLEEDEVTMSTVLGPIKYTIYVLEKDMTLYVVGYADYPDSVVAAKTEDELLDFAIEGAVASLKGTVVRKTPITMGEYRGRELVVDQVTMNQEHTIRIYLVGSRMYQLTVLIPKRDEFKKNRTRFFDGFRLLK